MADAPHVPDEFIPPSPVQALDVSGEMQRFMQHVYAWMAFALVISGWVAYYVVHNLTLLTWIFQKGLFMPLLLVELGLVFGLSWFLRKMSALTATVMFILYSFVTGLTLSVVFLVYQLGSIVSIFGVTAVIFTIMSVYGYYTKRDLTGIGTLAFFGLIGIIIAGVVNLFVQNTMADFIISAIGVVVFIALTAYDTQKIKAMNIIGNEWTEEDKKEAIMGALTLYLDFINLFLKLLRLFGKRR